MLTSLNVNQFLGKHSWEALQGDQREKWKIWRQVKDFYFQYISEHLVKEEDLLLLHEVPYVKEVEYVNCAGGTDYKKSSEVSEVYKEFEQYCKENDLEIQVPFTEDSSFFRTIAVFQKGAYRRIPIHTDEIFQERRNRILVLERAETDGAVIVGVHIPSDDRKYWDSLMALHQKLPVGRMILYVGDLNTYKPGTINQKKFSQFLSRGLVDVWLKKGYNPAKETYVSPESGSPARLDYVLMTEKDFEDAQCEIRIEDAVREQGYSDHSAVSVRFLKEARVLYASLKPTEAILGLFEEAKRLDADGLGNAEIFERAEHYLAENGEWIDLKAYSRKPAAVYSGVVPSSFKVRINDPDLDARINEILKKAFDIKRLMTPFKLRIILQAYIDHLKGTEALSGGKEGNVDSLRVQVASLVLRADEKKLRAVMEYMKYLESKESGTDS